MLFKLLAPLGLGLLSSYPSTSANVTVYTSSINTANIPVYTAAMNDQTTLQAPAPPVNLAGFINVQLYDGGMNGISVPVSGGFLGFSIELSVVTSLIGENAGQLRPEFLNYCAILEQRGGTVTIRVGGNSQDKASLVDANANGKTISKIASDDLSKTRTPIVSFTMDVFKVMAEVSKLVKANWFFGIPFVYMDQDGNAGLIMQNAISMLGDNLLALQLANEPDLYNINGKRGTDYNQDMFLAETGQMIQKLPITESILAGPSVCCFWGINDMLNAGYMDTYTQAIKYIDIMHYPSDNCQQGTPNARDPQTMYGSYLNHQTIQGQVGQYFEASNRALAAGKKFMVMETNTASCGGFPGISDSFTAALWGVDYAMQMTYGNFSHALLHFGGQNVYYNPFTPPPTNMTKYNYQWSTGAIFYSMIVVAEAIGTSGNAQVLDLGIDPSPTRAGYVVYEQGAASRVVLINYVSNPGASDYTAVIGIGGGQTGLPSKTPTTVKVKYLLAPSINEKHNITWAGQTFGDAFKSDGRLQGDLNVVTIQCDTNAMTCNIPVPAPSVALVFLTDQAYINSGGEIAKPLTFATTTTTGRHGTRLYVDPALLATSNGRNEGLPLGNSSKGSKNDSTSRFEPIARGLTLLAAGFAVAYFVM